MDDSAQPSSRQHQPYIEPIREKVYEDENGYVLADYLFNIQKVALHLHFNEGAWSANKYRRYLLIFDSILDNLKHKGYTEVCTVAFEDNVKAQKLIAMFGFKKTGTKRGFVLMKRMV